MISMKRKATQHLEERADRRSIAAYDAAQSPVEAAVCGKLREEIERAIPDATSKVWHGSPVWFVEDTPVVGYNVVAKGGVVLLFWNSQAFAMPRWSRPASSRLRRPGSRRYRRSRRCRSDAG